MTTEGRCDCPLCPCLETHAVLPIKAVARCVCGWSSLQECTYRLSLDLSIRYPGQFTVRHREVPLSKADWFPTECLGHGRVFPYSELDTAADAWLFGGQDRYGTGAAYKRRVERERESAALAALQGRLAL